MDRRAFLKGALAGAGALSAAPSLACVTGPVPPSDNVVAEGRPYMVGYIGQVALWPSLTEIPRNWLPCDGRLLQLIDELAAHAVIGTRFGGDGSNDFALPALTSPFAGTQYLFCHQGLFPPRLIDDAGLYVSGQVILSAGSFTPAGFVPCDGATLRVDEYSNLANALGVSPLSVFFNLPTLEPPIDGVSYYIQYTDVRADGEPLLGELAWRTTATQLSEYLPCDGRLVTTEQAGVDVAGLAEVIGNRFGGDFAQDGTVGLPDLPLTDDVVTLIRVINGRI